MQNYRERLCNTLMALNHTRLRNVKDDNARQETCTKDKDDNVIKIETWCLETFNVTLLASQFIQQHSYREAKSPIGPYFGKNVYSSQWQKTKREFFYSV